MSLEDETLTLEFSANAAFHRTLAEDPKSVKLLRDALYEVTGRKLTLAFVVGENGGEVVHEEHEPPTEEELISLLKDKFDATEVE